MQWMADDDFEDKLLALESMQYNASKVIPNAVFSSLCVQYMIWLPRAATSRANQTQRRAIKRTMTKAWTTTATMKPTQSYPPYSSPKRVPKPIMQRCLPGLVQILVTTTELRARQYKDRAVVAFYTPDLLTKLPLPKQRLPLALATTLFNQEENTSTQPATPAPSAVSTPHDPPTFPP